MADVNWRKYDCDICLAVTLAAAAGASALAVILLGAMGLSVMMQVILFLVIWAALGWVADGLCAARAMAPAADVTQPQPVERAADVAEPEAAEAVAAATASEEKLAAEAKAEEEAAAKQAAEEAEAKAVAEHAAAEAKLAEEAAAKAATDAATLTTDGVDRDGDGVVEGVNEGSRPQALDGPRDGTADDLKRIKGIGPKLELLCNKLGFYHFDQIAGWSADEVAWVDSNLEGFKGRVTRDDWVSQARQLAEGGETDFSKRVDEGAVPSSQ